MYNERGLQDADQPFGADVDYDTGSIYSGDTNAQVESMASLPYPLRN
jgi:hypothetical protein